MIINGKDAFKTWGVFLADGSEAILKLKANNKQIVTNKSPIEHGVRVSFSDLYTDEREFMLNINISAKTKAEFFKKYDEFTKELSKGWVKMAVYDTTFNLLAKDFMKLSHLNSIGILNVKFWEPNPNNR